MRNLSHAQFSAGLGAEPAVLVALSPPSPHDFPLANPKIVHHELHEHRRLGRGDAHCRPAWPSITPCSIRTRPMPISLEFGKRRTSRRSTRRVRRRSDSGLPRPTGRSIHHREHGRGIPIVNTVETSDIDGVRIRVDHGGHCVFTRHVDAIHAASFTKGNRQSNGQPAATSQPGPSGGRATSSASRLTLFRPARNAGKRGRGGKRDAGAAIATSIAFASESASPTFRHAAAGLDDRHASNAGTPACQYTHSSTSSDERSFSPGSTRSDAPDHRRG